ncbi:MAG: hypothetical protein LLG13_18615 [Bacteroidales bacterium]|nr:hypothetical protein [Bacteroidales bacterium]
MMKSKLGTLDIRDILHGIIMAFLTTLLTGIIDTLQKGAVFDWPSVRLMLIAGISAALSYLLKCLASNSNNQLFTREPV